MARRNILAAALLLTFSLAYGLLTIELPDRGLPNTPGPAFFPWLITAGMTILSVALLVRGVRELGASAQAPTSPIALRGWLALAIFLTYLTLLPALGFLTASIPFFAALTLLYGERNPLLVVLTAAGVPALLFVGFRYGFQMLLPQGVWW